MNMIKAAILSTIAILAVPVFAETQPNTPPAPAAKAEQFDQFKQRALARTDKEIEMLQQSKTCLSAAQDKAAAEVCRKNKMDAMQKFHSENKEHMQDMKKNMDKMKETHQEMMDKTPMPAMK
jgi:hypothetical protein